MKTKQKIALARSVQILIMVARKLIGLGPTAQVTRRGITWDLDLREGIDFSIWLLGGFEPMTIRAYQRIVKPGDIVLDVGANVGAHTLPLADSVGRNGRVLAFEPTDYAFAKLKSNCALNPSLSGRIQLFQNMLVDEVREGEPTPSLYSSWPRRNEEGLHQFHQGRMMSTRGAEARTLDSLVQSLGLQRVDCIKVDIDGFECVMFRGAKQILERWHPTLIMELAPYQLEEQGASLEELLQLLGEHRYRLLTLSHLTHLTMNPTELRRLIPVGSSLNVIARVEQPSDAE
jgi:FkbM family methyltransferase